MSHLEENSKGIGDWEAAARHFLALRVASRGVAVPSARSLGVAALMSAQRAALCGLRGTPRSVRTAVRENSKHPTAGYMEHARGGSVGPVAVGLNAN